MRQSNIAIVMLLLMVRNDVIAGPSTNALPRYLGASTCSSTSCHGGADEKKNQDLIWTKHDFHSRSYATLTSARADRFADVLKLGDVTKNPRCTVCHAPLGVVPEQNRLLTAKAIHGVSCENCHGPAENWLRSHTRPDFSHADRVAAGLRDLKDLYVRANTCVACHQTLDRDIAAAGHPELTFELDGQSVSEPKHWREAEVVGPKAWLIGQVVALREMSWQLDRGSQSDENLTARWNALVWLLQQLDDVDPSLRGLKALQLNSEKTDFAAAQKTCDSVAQSVNQISWTSELTHTCLVSLGKTAAAFQDSNVPKNLQAWRAERLVLALDRLSLRDAGASMKKTDLVVGRLFKLAQSIPDFDPEAFAKELSALPSL